MPEPAVVCQGIAKRFEAVAAVVDLDLAVQPGRFLALLGPSGCGKTTTLRLLAGFERPDAGAIAIAGQPVAGPGMFLPPEKRRVGLVFQDYALFPHLDVAHNVAYGLPRGAARAPRVEELLGLVGLEGLGRRMPHELSGGQQQRVALARALAPRPALVLLDEPFSNLDSRLRARVRAEVRQILATAPTTAVFVTHDQQEALSLADEVAVMGAGRVLQCAPPALLYCRPATRAVAEFVGDANFLPGEARGLEASCALGCVALAEPTRGPVDLLLRPEAIRLDPASEARGQVVFREYFGHDQLVTVRLATGDRLRVRLGPDHALDAGDPIGLHVPDRLIAFPR